MCAAILIYWGFTPENDTYIKSKVICLSKKNLFKGWLLNKDNEDETDPKRDEPGGKKTRFLTFSVGCQEGDIDEDDALVL